jgi:starch phosphorylase
MLLIMNFANLKDPIAFFCAEYAIDNELPTYSGGLGVLAGDYVNEAAMNQYPMVGIGILYKGKDFVQHITPEGKVETKDTEFDHDASFLRPTTVDGKPITIELKFDYADVKVKSYHIRLSDNTTLFFLSTDIDGNPPEWTSDMDALYRGDTDSQIRQQILLGLGGVKLLNQLGVKPKLYHINEGRPEFIIWELATDSMKNEGKTIEEAWKEAKEKIIYTNHTLVAAGNLVYPIEKVSKWASNYTRGLNIDPNLLIKDGVSNNEFNTTLFALNISKKQLAVSQIHEKHARTSWPNYQWSHITNGVNMFRWQDSDFRNPNISDAKIWEIHMLKKSELVTTVKKRTGFEFDPNRLVISWARRLAEYKQPRVIFEDVKRLKVIIENQEKPVQILFAGNSHTADPNSKSIIEEIIKLFSTDLTGHAIFLPNYNLSLANHLTSGSDVWLNTPKGNLEASGTSGMKAVANGVLNCTIVDGWTYEVDWEGAGWTLDPNNASGSFYQILEENIVPLYYKRGDNGLPGEWIERMRKSIQISSEYSTERMFSEYRDKVYK